MRALLLFTLIFFSLLRTSNAQVSGYQGKRFMVTGAAHVSSQFIADWYINDIRPFAEISAGMIVSRASCLSVSVRQIQRPYKASLYYYVPANTDLEPSPNGLYYRVLREKVRVTDRIFTLDYRTFLRKKAGEIAPCGLYLSVSAGISMSQVTGKSPLAAKVFNAPFLNGVVFTGVGKQQVLFNRLLLDCGISVGSTLAGFKTYTVPESSSYYYYDGQPELDGEPETDYNRYYEGQRITQELLFNLFLNPYLKLGIIL